MHQTRVKGMTGMMVHWMLLASCVLVPLWRPDGGCCYSQAMEDLAHANKFRVCPEFVGHGVGRWFHSAPMVLPVASRMPDVMQVGLPEPMLPCLECLWLPSLAPALSLACCLSCPLAMLSVATWARNRTVLGRM